MENMGHEFVVEFCTRMKRFKYGVIAFWVGFLALGCWAAPMFMKNTQIEVTAPHGYPSHKAQQLSLDKFPGQKRVDNVNMMVVKKPAVGKHALINGSKKFNGFALELKDDIVEWQKDHCETDIIGMPFNYSTAATYNLMNLSEAASSFVSKDNLTGLISLNVYRAADSCMTNFYPWLKSHMKDLADEVNANGTYNTEAPLSVSVVGLQYLSLDSTAGIEQDMVSIDGVSLPLAMIILCVVIRSAKLLALPLISVMLSVASSFTIMYPISTAINVVSYCPSLMISLIVAMSIDYSLFLASRYKEELSRKADPMDAVAIMLTSAGHMVLVSGSIFVCCMLSLTVFYQDPILLSFGIGASVAILMCMLANLTMTPAMLYSFPGFFSGRSGTCMDAYHLLRQIFGLPATSSSQKDDAGMDASLLEDSPASWRAGLLESKPANDGHHELDDVNRAMHPEEELPIDLRGVSPMWIKLGKFTARFKWPLAVTITLGLLLPGAILLPDFKVSMDYDAVIPSRSDSGKAFKQLAQAFSKGETLMHDFYFSTLDGSSILNEDYFNEAQAVITKLYGDDRTKGVLASGHQASTRGLFYIKYPFPINVTQLVEAHSTSCGLTGTAPVCKCNHEVCFLQLAYDSYLSADKTTGKLQLALPIDPVSEEGVQWLQDARDVIDDFDSKKLYVGIGGLSAYEMDSVHLAYSELTLLFSLVGIVVFVLQLVAFRSLAMAMYTVVSLALTLACVYGVSVAVYTKDSLRDLGIKALSGDEGVYWGVPLLCFTMLVGLGVDYNVFLLTRVIEYRQLGFTDDAAIILGTARTGPIITAAGMIMIVAFGSLTLSGTFILNQFGFYLALAVFFDTFVVRTVMVPAMMNISGPLNWWWATVPPGIKDIMD